MLFDQKSTILITCPAGALEYVKKEVSDLGFPVVSESAAGAEIRATLHDAMTLNLYLRTGHRVLFLLSEFTAKNPDELYRNLSILKWDDIVPDQGYLCVTSNVDTYSIRDSRYANVTCKDAIVDRIRNKRGKRPDSGPDRNRTVIHLYWKDIAARVYIDTSGEPLSKRGYRKIPLEAPLQETLAAVLISASVWNRKDNFINPMCGSGTLAIEASLMALHRAPALCRDNFGFMHISGFDKERWEKLRKSATAASENSFPGMIIASDSRKEAVEATRKNARNAGVEHFIRFDDCGFADTPVPPGRGVVMLNPGYGERMGKISDLTETYREIGDFFKHRCRGYTGYIFTGNPSLAKKVGLRTRRRLAFFNGPIECRLLEYELYEGTKKAGKHQFHK